MVKYWVNKVIIKNLACIFLILLMAISFNEVNGKSNAFTGICYTNTGPNYQENEGSSPTEEDLLIKFSAKVIDKTGSNLIQANEYAGSHIVQAITSSYYNFKRFKDETEKIIHESNYASFHNEWSELERQEDAHLLIIRVSETHLINLIYHEEDGLFTFSIYHQDYL